MKQITIQSMCDTKTHDVAKTVAQILQLEREGCDLVRVAIPDIKSAKAIKKIKAKIHIPLIADIHFDPDLAIEAIKNGADKIRINPGNILGPKGLQNKKAIQKLKEIIKAARKAKTSAATKLFNPGKTGIPIRIGINSGSLEQSLIDKYKGPTSEALVESALSWIKFFESQNFRNLVISIKSTDVNTTIEANELLFKAMQKRAKYKKIPRSSGQKSARADFLASAHASATRVCLTARIYPIHLGVTEAGPLIPGAIRNAVALGHLLRKGIGDTIRISLTETLIKEVKVAKELLKSLGLYNKEPIIISCPTCARTEINLKKLVKEIEKEIWKLSRTNFSVDLSKNPVSSKIRNQKFGKHQPKPLKIAVMGCVVNGPGEAREADFAICGGKNSGAIYKKGKFIKSVPEKLLVKEFIKLINT